MMHRKKKYQLLKQIFIMVFFLSAYLPSVHMSSYKTKSHVSAYHRTSRNKQNKQTKRSDVKRPLSKFEGNVYTVANIEQLNTVHSVVLNPAFSRKGIVTKGMSPMTSQTKSLITQNVLLSETESARKKEKLLTHVTNVATEDFDDPEKTFYGSKKNPAKSCRDIFLSDREMPSGNYWIKTADGELLLVTCGFPGRSGADSQDLDDITGQNATEDVTGNTAKEFKTYKYKGEEELKKHGIGFEKQKDNGDSKPGINQVSKNENSNDPLNIASAKPKAVAKKDEHDEFQFVKIEANKHEGKKIKPNPVIAPHSESEKRRRPDSTGPPKRTPTKALKVFADVQLHATLIPRAKRFQEKPYRSLPTSKVKKQTTKLHVLNTPTGKSNRYTTHDPTSMFEAMEYVLHPTKHGASTISHAKPTSTRRISAAIIKPGGSTTSHAKPTSTRRISAAIIKPTKPVNLLDNDVNEIETTQRVKTSKAVQQKTKPKEIKESDVFGGDQRSEKVNNPTQNKLNDANVVSQEVNKVNNKVINKKIQNGKNASQTSHKPMKSTGKEGSQDEDVITQVEPSPKEKNEKIKTAEDSDSTDSTSKPTKPSSSEYTEKTTKTLFPPKKKEPSKGNETKQKELLDNSEELLKNSKELLKNSKEILENSKEPLENSKELLQNSKEILKDTKNSSTTTPPRHDSPKADEPSPGIAKPSSPGVVALMPVPPSLGGASLQLPNMMSPDPVTQMSLLQNTPDPVTQMSLLQNNMIGNGYGGVPLVPNQPSDMMNPYQNIMNDAGGTQHIVVPSVTIGTDSPAGMPKVETFQQAGAGDLGDIQDEERPPSPKLKSSDEIYGRKEILGSKGTPEEIKNSVTTTLSLDQYEENAQVRSWQSHEKAMKEKHDFDKQYKTFQGLDADPEMPHLKENQENARTRSWSEHEFKMQSKQVQQQYDDFAREDIGVGPSPDFTKFHKQFERMRNETLANISKDMKKQEKTIANETKESTSSKHEGNGNTGNSAEKENEPDDEYQKYVKQVDNEPPVNEEDKKYETYTKQLDSGEAEQKEPTNITSFTEPHNTTNDMPTLNEKINDKGNLNSLPPSSNQVVKLDDASLQTIRTGVDNQAVKLDDASLQTIKTGVDKLIPLINQSNVVIQASDEHPSVSTNAPLGNSSSNTTSVEKDVGKVVKKADVVTARKRQYEHSNRNYKLFTVGDVTNKEDKPNNGREGINIIKMSSNPSGESAGNNRLKDFQEEVSPGSLTRKVIDPYSPMEAAHSEKRGEHMNTVKIEESEAAIKRAEDDKYTLYKRLQQGGLKADDGKSSNIYVDNRVFIYGGPKNRNEVLASSGFSALPKEYSKTGSLKSKIGDSDINVAREPNRVVMMMKQPISKIVNMKDEDMTNNLTPLSNHKEMETDLVDTNKLIMGNSSNEMIKTKEINSSDKLADSNLTQNSAHEGEEKEGIKEMRRKPKFTSLPNPYNFIVPETRRFSNIMQNDSSTVDTKLDNIGTTTKSNILPYSQARHGYGTYHTFSADNMNLNYDISKGGNSKIPSASSIDNKINSSIHDETLKPVEDQWAISGDKKNNLGVSNDKQHTANQPTPGNETTDAKEEGTPILIYFTQDKNANVPGEVRSNTAAQNQEALPVTLTNKRSKKIVKLEKSVIKSLKEKDTAQNTQMLTKQESLLTFDEASSSSSLAENTPRNSTIANRSLKIRSKVKTEIEPPPSLRNETPRALKKTEVPEILQQPVTRNLNEKDANKNIQVPKEGISKPPLAKSKETFANLVKNASIRNSTAENEITAITGDKRYISSINQENLPGADDSTNIAQDSQNTEEPPEMIDLQPIHNPLQQVTHGMQDMITQAQATMGNVPGLTNETKNAENGNITNNGSKEANARETIPQPVEKSPKEQLPKQINAEKLPLVDKRFQIPKKEAKIAGKRCNISEVDVHKKSDGENPSVSSNKSHNLKKRESEADDLMLYYRNSNEKLGRGKRIHKKNEIGDTTSQFQNINNAQLLEDIVDANRNADISELRNFHVPNAESIISMPELHILNLINRSLNTAFNIQTLQLGGTQINNVSRYPITKKQIIKIIKSIEKLHPEKKDETPKLDYSKISEMALNTFQKFLSRHNVSMSLHGDEFPEEESEQGRYANIANERSRKNISERRMLFGGSRPRTFRQMILEENPIVDMLPKLERSLINETSGESMERIVISRKYNVIEKETNKQDDIRKRELIPSRVGVLQPSNLKPMPPVGHDPDEEPFQAIPGDLETPSTMNDSKSVHTTNNQNEGKEAEGGPDRNSDTSKTSQYNSDTYKSAQYNSDTSKSAQYEERKDPKVEEQDLKNNLSTTSPIDKPFRFNWTKMEDQKQSNSEQNNTSDMFLLNLNYSMTEAGLIHPISTQQDNRPDGNVSTSKVFEHDKEHSAEFNSNSTTEHRQDEHETQTTPKLNSLNSNASASTQSEQPIKVKVHDPGFDYMEESRRNETNVANKNKKVSENEEHKEQESPPVEEDGKPHADSGPQEHRVTEAQAKAPVEPPNNETAPDVGETDKGEIGSGHVTALAKKIKPIIPKDDNTYQDNAIDTTFEAGLKEEERKAAASKLRAKTHTLSGQEERKTTDMRDGTDGNIASSKNSQEEIEKPEASLSKNEGTNKAVSYGNKVYHQARKISSIIDQDNKTHPSNMLITSEASYGSRVNVTKLQIDINPLSKASSNETSTKDEIKEKEIKDFKESLEDLVKQQHTNVKYPHLKLPTKNGDYIGPLDIFDDLGGSQPTKTTEMKYRDEAQRTTESPTTLKMKNKWAEYNPNKENGIDDRKVSYEPETKLEPTRSTPTTRHRTPKRTPKIGKINHNYDNDEEFQNIVDSTPTETGAKKPTRKVRPVTVPVVSNKIHESSKPIKEMPATLNENKAENSGLNWTLVQELLRKEAQAKEAAKPSKGDEGGGGEYVPLLANTSDGKAIPLIPIPMDSPLGKLLYPALSQKESSSPQQQQQQQTDTNINNFSPNSASSNDELDLSSLLFEQPQKPINQRSNTINPNLLNKLLQAAKYIENPLEIQKSLTNKKEVVLLPDKRGSIIPMGKPLKTTFDIGSLKLNAFRDNVSNQPGEFTARLITPSSTNNNIINTNNNNYMQTHGESDRNDGQIHITVQKRNGQLLLVPDLKEAYERQMVPQSIKLDLQYKVTQLQKKDEINWHRNARRSLRRKEHVNYHIHSQKRSLQKKDINSHRKSQRSLQRKSRNNAYSHVLLKRKRVRRRPIEET